MTGFIGTSNSHYTVSISICAILEDVEITSKTRYAIIYHYKRLHICTIEKMLFYIAIVSSWMFQFNFKKAVLKVIKL